MRSAAASLVFVSLLVGCAAELASSEPSESLDSEALVVLRPFSERLWYSRGYGNLINGCPEAPANVRQFRYHEARDPRLDDHALYVIGGTCTWYPEYAGSGAPLLYRNYLGPATYVDGPDVDGSLSEPIMRDMAHQIVAGCRDLGRCQVSLAGASRGAIMINAAFFIARNEEPRLRVATNVQLDPVDTLITGFTDVAPGHVIHLRKLRPRDFIAGVFSNAYLDVRGAASYTLSEFDYDHVDMMWMPRPRFAAQWFMNRHLSWQLGTDVLAYQESTEALLDHGTFANHSSDALGYAAGAVVTSSGGGVRASNYDEGPTELVDADLSCDGMHWLSPYPADGGSPWIEIRLPRPQWVGSIRLHTVGSEMDCHRGRSGGNGVRAFRIQTWDGSAWRDRGSQERGTDSAPTQRLWFPVFTDRVRIAEIETVTPHRSAFVREVEIAGGCFLDEC